MPDDPVVPTQAKPARSVEFLAARDWLRHRWRQEWPNEAHCQQLADYAVHLAAEHSATARAEAAEKLLIRFHRRMAIACDQVKAGRDSTVRVPTAQWHLLMNMAAEAHAALAQTAASIGEV